MNCWVCSYISVNRFFYACAFQVLGVSPIAGFEMVKVAYAKKRKEAEKNNDEATAARVGYNTLSIDMFIHIYLNIYNKCLFLIRTLLLICWFMYVNISIEKDKVYLTMGSFDL